MRTRIRIMLKVMMLKKMINQK